MDQTRLKSYLALAFAVLVWGAVPAIVRDLALAMGPADATVIRLCVNSLCALPLLAVFGSKLERGDLVRFTAISIIGNFGYYLGSIYGFANVSAGAGGMIYATNPLFIVALSVAVGIERLTWPVVAGLAISFAGTIYLFSGGLNGTGASPVFGGLMLLMGCAGWAVYAVYGKAFIAKYGPITVTLWSLILCTPPSFALASASTWATLTQISGVQWAELFFLSLVGTLLSINLWNYASGNLPPSSTGASLYLIPPIAAVAGFLWSGEKTGWPTLLGGLIILIGVAMAEFGKSSKMARS